MKLITATLAAILTMGSVRAQTPGDYFRSAGVGFRETSEEQQLFWQPHIEESHRRILAAAETAGGREVATLLGPGVCSEIPLEALARRFERVLMVDMDGASMVEAVEQLPLELRGKVELRVTDVTSFAAALMERLSAAVDESESDAEAFERFGTIFDDMRLGDYLAKLPQSDLVVSSLVLSELPRYPLAYADRLVRLRFDVRLRQWERHDDTRARLHELIIADHVRLLTKLCRPDGVIYFSDTVARGPAYSQFPAEIRTAVEAKLSPDFHGVGRLCHGEFGVERETTAFERLLADYEQAGTETFEPLLSMSAVEGEWKKRGLTVVGQPNAWWWLEYPCAIAHSPGAFRVRSWVLRP